MSGEREMTVSIRRSLDVDVVVNLQIKLKGVGTSMPKRMKTTRTLIRVRGMKWVEGARG